MEPSSEVFSWGLPILRMGGISRPGETRDPYLTSRVRGHSWNMQHINSLKKCKPCNLASRQKTKDSNSTVLWCLSSVVSALNDVFLWAPKRYHTPWNQQFAFWMVGRSHFPFGAGVFSGANLQIVSGMKHNMIGRNRQVILNRGLKTNPCKTTTKYTPEN